MPPAQALKVKVAMIISTMNAPFVLRQVGYILCLLVALAIFAKLFGRYDTRIINSIQLQLFSTKDVVDQPATILPVLSDETDKINRNDKKGDQKPTTKLSFCVPSQSSETIETCGKEFGTDWLQYLENFGLTDERTANISEEEDIRTMKLVPKFVAAFSDNHFSDAKKTLLKGFAKHLPNETLIVYSLGLNAEHLKELENNPQVVEVRKLPFSKYPEHVKNLYGYHWKPLLIADFLKEHNAIFYMDAHISWNTPDIKSLIDKLSCNIRCPNACEHYPMTLLWDTGHSIFATTKSDSYKYFPVNLNLTKSIEMGCAGFQLTYGTSDVRKNILKWVVLCALEKNCMAPPGIGLSCNWGENKYDYYANCHRFDQSIFNILLAQRHDFNRSRYFIPFNKVPPKKINV